MQEDKPSIEPESPGPEEVWKAFDDTEGEAMQIKMTTDELCARARSRESENVRFQWLAAVGLIVFGAAFSYNVFSNPHPWIRLAQAWLLGLMCFVAWTILREGPRRIRTNENCASFLQREFEWKRKRLLEVRRGLLLFIPAFLASWWGGGPALKAKAWGIDPSSWLFQFSEGPWPFLIVGLVLTFTWFAYGREAEKAKREIEAIRRYIRT